MPISDDEFSESQSTMNVVDEEVTATDVSDEGVAPEVGQTEEVVEETVETEAPESSPTYTVKVDGEDVEVSLEEALAGYQRQADYTKKTQELAGARALKTAIESNPEYAVRQLAAQFGVELGQGTVSQQEPEQTASDDSAFQNTDPTVQWMIQREQERYLDEVLGGLSSKYGDLYDEEELLSTAMSRGINDPGRLPELFQTITFDKMLAQQQAVTAKQDADKADDAQREQAVVAANQIVSAGNGVTGGAPATSPPEINDIDDAVLLAAKTLGLDIDADDI